MIHVHFLFLFILFGMSCSEPELVLDNELDPGNPDFIPPETSIISPVDGTELNQHSQINVIWEGNADDMEFQYSLDDDDWSDWSSLTVTTLNYLDEGSHIFFVQGRHASGLVEEWPDTLNISVDAIDGPSLRIEYLYTEVAQLATFTVDVVAEDVELVAAAGIVLEYNGDALELQDVVMGDFFSLNGGDIIYFDTLATSAGTTTLQLDVGTYGGEPEYVTGTGVIATLEFMAKTSGEYEIEFSDETTLRKSDNATISTDELVEGVVLIE